VLTLDTEWLQARVLLDREVVTRESLADALEHRLYGAHVDQGEVRRGCDYAAEVGVAAVLCRPEHVAIAARRLLGSGTATVTPLALHDAALQRDPAALAREALELVAAGADQVALTVEPGLDRQGCLHLVSEQVAAVVEAVTPQGGKVRVLLNPTHATKHLVRACTTLVGTRGPTLVQGGSFRGSRATFSQVEAMRHALPADVLLKWAEPVRSVEMMLLCMSLGVGRFNGDIPMLLAAAKRSSQLGPLMLPIYGVDF
jgi:deoxyribose-phosphate aldolase